MRSLADADKCPFCKRVSDRGGTIRRSLARGVGGSCKEGILWKGLFFVVRRCSASGERREARGETSARLWRTIGRPPSVAGG